jgi:oligopeptide transport system substrate-binding protein
MRYRHLCFLLLMVMSVFTACSREETPSQTSSETLRIAFDDDPSSLDPRLLRDISGTTVVHMLYEGLMRRDLDGNLVPALAKEVNVSDDRTTYTFQLRDSKWSNGDPVTADDFVYAWRTILDPSFPSPNAYQLFVVKNGKAVKEGQMSVDSLGINATAPNTLVITLEAPTPYFLELLDFHPFFPIHKSITANQEQPVTNGPYLLDSWRHQHEMNFKKNPDYWDSDHVGLSNVQAFVVDPQTALHMFEAGEIDWVGSPVGSLPPDLVPALQKAGNLYTAEGAGTRWIRFNTSVEPLNNKKIRQAINCALNREAITKHITHGTQQPALSIVPPSLFSAGGPCFADHDTATAKQLLAEALSEMNLTVDQLPTLTLSYATHHQAAKIAAIIQQQLKEALGLRVTLAAQENKVFFDNLSHKHYQMALGAWVADFKDPTNFLNPFKYKSNGTNNTEWEDPKYRQLLTEAEEQTGEEERFNRLRKAEEFLIDEAPVTPIYFIAFLYVKPKGLNNVYFSPLGYIDVRQAEKN